MPLRYRADWSTRLSKHRPDMNHVIRVRRYGGPEVLQWETEEHAALGPCDVRLQHMAIGLNFVDVYERGGLYKPPLPFVPGHEGAGVVLERGAEVTHVAVGDRVAYATGGTGAYCEQRIIAADRVVRLADAIANESAAALILKGLTAYVLARKVFPLGKGHVALIHAAAGGVGMILTQWAKHLGAHVVAVVGSEEKRELVRAQGADHVWLSKEPWGELLRSLGGVHVAYDSVGLDTFAESLDCLKHRGMMVSFGNASGPPPAISPLELSKRGSLFLTRPSLFDYISTYDELYPAAQELFDLIARSVIAVHIGQTYPLQDAARAHRELESRHTTGSTVLVP
jgi:NADPH2:quinone reductase